VFSVPARVRDTGPSFAPVALLQVARAAEQPDVARDLTGAHYSPGLSKRRSKELGSRPASLWIGHKEAQESQTTATAVSRQDAKDAERRNDETRDWTRSTGDAVGDGTGELQTDRIDPDTDTDPDAEEDRGAERDTGDSVMTDASAFSTSTF